MEECLEDHKEFIFLFGWFSSSARVKTGLTAIPSCPICGFHSKDILQILRDCTTAKDVWSQIITGNHLTNFFSLNLQDWILFNVHDASVVTEGGASWACLFVILVWRI